jgi:hypothetical protein
MANNKAQLTKLINHAIFKDGMIAKTQNRNIRLSIRVNMSLYKLNSK